MKPLGKAYIHVDNGGYTFEVLQGEDRETELIGPQIKITCSFYGYHVDSITMLEITPKNLTTIGQMFLDAAASAAEAEAIAVAEDAAEAARFRAHEAQE